MDGLYSVSFSCRWRLKSGATANTKILKVYEQILDNQVQKLSKNLSLKRTKQFCLFTINIIVQANRIEIL